MKKVISVLLVVFIIFGLSTNIFAISTEFAKTFEDESNLWLVENSEKSAARLNYEKLLSEDLSGGDVRPRFDELFGNNITAEYILENYAEIFGTPENQVDQGLIQLLTLNCNEFYDELSAELIEDDPIVEIIPGLENSEDAIPAPPPLDVPNSNALGTDNVPSPEYETAFSDMSKASSESAIPDFSETSSLPSGSDEERTLSAESETMPVYESEPPLESGVSNSEAPSSLSSSEGISNSISDSSDNSLAAAQTPTTGITNSKSAVRTTQSNVSATVALVSVTTTSITFDVAFSPLLHQSHFVQWYDRPSATWNYIRGRNGAPAATTERITMSGLVPNTAYSVYVGAWDATLGAWSTAQINPRTAQQPTGGGNNTGNTGNSTLQLVNKQHTPSLLGQLSPHPGRRGMKLPCKHMAHIPMIPLM